MHLVFLDANILFSAAWSAESGVTRIWSLSGVDLITSDYALCEAARNLDQPEQQARLNELMTSVKLCGELPATGILFTNIELPEKDMPILLAAIESGASCLVTGDKKHFGQYMGKSIEGVRVCTPREFLRLMAGRAEDGSGIGDQSG